MKILATYSPIRTPAVINIGEIGEKNYLLIEFIEKSVATARFWEDFGQSLAQQHQVTNETFGLDHDNHIGRLHQKNMPKGAWVDFFIENRLEPQLQMAEVSGKVNTNVRQKFDNLYSKLTSLLPEEDPALLHGDLWSGNFMAATDGKVFIFDPAVFYGHREAEVAFTHMFGGFDKLFYSTYNEQFSLLSGFDERIDLYNLYPLLVHLNLFGASYLSGISQTLAKYL